MKPTRVTLAPYKTEILKRTAEEGQQAGSSLARELTGYKGYGFHKWLKEMTGDEDFGLHPTNPKSIRSNYWILRTKIDQAFLQVISNLETIADKERENVELEQELKLLKWKLMEARREGAPFNELKICEVYCGK